MKTALIHPSQSYWSENNVRQLPEFPMARQKLHNLWLFQFNEDGSMNGNPHKLSDTATAINDMLTIDVPLVVAENQTLYLLVLGPKLDYDMSGVRTLDELKNGALII